MAALAGKRPKPKRREPAGRTAVGLEKFAPLGADPDVERMPVSRSVRLPRKGRGRFRLEPDREIEERFALIAGHRPVSRMSPMIASGSALRPRQMNSTCGSAVSAASASLISPSSSTMRRRAARIVANETADHEECQRRTATGEELSEHRPSGLGKLDFQSGYERAEIHGGSAGSGNNANADPAVRLPPVRRSSAADFALPASIVLLPFPSGNVSYRHTHAVSFLPRRRSRIKDRGGSIARYREKTAQLTIGVRPARSDLDAV